MRNGSLRCPNPKQSCNSVVIDTSQVFDSCRDRDCFEDVRVFLDELGQSIIEHTTQVRTKSAEICGSAISVEPVHLSRGFYRATVRLYVKLELEACLNGGCGARSQCFAGVAAVEKSVVLFGGEGNVHVFRSGVSGDGFCQMPRCDDMGSNLPTAVVETVDPVILGTRVVEPSVCQCFCCCSCGEIPGTVASQIGNLCEEGSRYLAVSLGFFSVIRLERPGQFLVQAVEYCVPDKECAQVDNSSPCDAFRRMAFPTDAFLPGKAAPIGPASCAPSPIGVCEERGNDCSCK